MRTSPELDVNAILLGHSNSLRPWIEGAMSGALILGVVRVK